MNIFHLSLPAKIDFGWGITNSLPAHIKSFGDNALIFTGEASLYESGIINNIADALSDVSISYNIIKVANEPSVELIDEIANELRSSENGNFDVIVAIGGGSVIDTAKAIGVMLGEGCSICDFLGSQPKTVVGKHIPLIAVPSTSGSGSETSDTAFINEKGYKKHLLRHDCLLPDLVLTDPSLTITVPQNIMLDSVMLCLSQLIEMYISNDASSFTDVLMIEGIRRLDLNMNKAVFGSGDTEVHDNLSYASMLSGIGITNARHTVYSGIAQSISAIYDISYGAICSALLYATSLVNMRKVQLFDPNSTATAKYAMVGAVLSGLEYDFEKHHVLLRAASQRLLEMRSEFSVPLLKELGVLEDDFYKIASSIEQGSNPVELAETEIIEILEMSY